MGKHAQALLLAVLAAAGACEAARTGAVRGASHAQPAMNGPFLSEDDMPAAVGKARRLAAASKTLMGEYDAEMNRLVRVAESAKCAAKAAAYTAALAARDQLSLDVDVRPQLADGVACRHPGKEAEGLRHTVVESPWTQRMPAADFDGSDEPSTSDDDESGSGPGLDLSSGDDDSGAASGEGSAPAPSSGADGSSGQAAEEEGEDDDDEYRSDDQ